MAKDRLCVCVCYPVFLLIPSLSSSLQGEWAAGLHELRRVLPHGPGQGESRDADICEHCPLSPFSVFTRQTVSVHSLVQRAWIWVTSIFGRRKHFGVTGVTPQQCCPQILEGNTVWVTPCNRNVGGRTRHLSTFPTLIYFEIFRCKSSACWLCCTWDFSHTEQR